MKYIELVNNNSFKWFSSNSSYCKGYIYDENNEFFTNIDVLEYFSGVKSEDDLINKLNRANGFFSIIIELENYIFIAVDRIRSFPLFYFKNSKDFYVSDNINCIICQNNCGELDDCAANEFMISGYVTGNDTLFKNINQLKAGQYIIYDKTNYNLKVKYYYKFTHDTNENILDKNLMLNKLNKTYLEAFEKTIRTLNGRTVIIPLSGGCDSRCVAVMLKKLNYDKVICYSYGKKQNEESNISKQIANKLGYKWVFIEYNEEIWNKCFYSNKMNEYLQFAGNGYATPVIQDWPAVYYMKEKNIIPDDSIFIPGYSGDMVAGSHIPKEFMYDKNITRNQIINAIMWKHYSLTDIYKFEKKYIEYFKKKIEYYLSDNKTYSKSEAADIVERQDLEERQAKFINNAVRVYEFFGYEWRTPLWDKDILEFWAKVPVDYRINRRLYFEYDDNFCINYINGFNKDLGQLTIYNNSHIDYKKMLLKKAIQSLDSIYLYAIIKKVKSVINKNNIYKEFVNHPLAWNCLMGEDGYKKYNDIYSFLSMYYLRLILKTN